MRVNSERGRTEYLLVGLVRGTARAFGVSHGQGLGFRHDVQRRRRLHHHRSAHGDPGFRQLRCRCSLLGQRLEPADLVIIGSHCVGLDLLIGKLMRQGIRVKSLYVGSMGGLAAAKREECDIAGVHLMDPATGEYNRPLLTDTLSLVPGLRPDAGHRPSAKRSRDSRESGATTRSRAALRRADCVMVNRNAGSGTRIIIDKLLGAHRPAGYGTQTKSHNAVAAAVAPGTRGLGRGDRHRGQAIRAGIHPAAGRAVRLHRAHDAIEASGSPGVLRIAGEMRKCGRSWLRWDFA